MSEYIIKQIAAASVPNAPVGAFTLFLDTDGNWKKKDENGVVSLVAGVTDKNLEQVLTVGNSTGNNDIVVQDNNVIKSSTGDTIMSFGSNTMTINAGSFATDVSVSNVSMNSLGTSMSLFKSDFSKIGFFQVIENSTGNQTTGPLPNYPVVSGSQNSTINQNVINTSINGGNNIIAKTNNTDYSNQNGYNTGTAGELIVKHTPSSTDRTQTHQDKDGTIALLSDISSGSVDSVTGDGVDNTDPSNPVLSFPDASQVANAFDKSSDDASDINMASSSQTVQNKIVTMQNEINSNISEILDLDNNKRDLTAQKNSIESDSGDLQLVNDEASPTANKNYGTDSNGVKGFKNDIKYSKIVVFDSSALSNFNTNVFTDVPGMQILIDRDGDYTFYAALNCNNDQNEEVDYTIGLTPITNRIIDTPTGPVTVLAGTQFISTFQAVNDTQRKKQDQTLDATFLLDNLEDGDLVDFMLNTRNDNCDLSNRRAYGYTINNND